MYLSLDESLEFLECSLFCELFWFGLTLELEDCWVSSDSVLLAEISVLVTVDLGNDDLLVLDHGLSELLVCWGESLAVSAPWGEELDKDWLSFSDLLVEVGCCQLDNGGVGDGKEQKGKNGSHFCFVFVVCVCLSVLRSPFYSPSSFFFFHFFLGKG